MTRMKFQCNFLISSTLFAVLFAATKASYNGDYLGRVSLMTSNGARRQREPVQQQNWLSPKMAANKMNSISFLEYLVGSKNSTQEVFYQEKLKQQTQSPAILCVPNILKTNDQDSSNDSTHDMDVATSCEYSGKLWFMPKTLRFLETVKVADVSSCGKRSIVECITKFKRGKKWVDCSRITCTFLDGANVADTNPIGVEMDVTCDILVPISFLKSRMREIVRETYKNAAEAYYEEIESASDEEARRVRRRRWSDCVWR